MKAETVRLFIIFLFVPFSIFSQDLRFGMGHASNQFLNPALTGASNISVLTYQYRNQWPTLSGAVESQLITYERAFVGHSRFGVYALHDKNKVSSISDFGLSYARSLQLTRGLSLLLGTSAILKYSHVKVNKLAFGDPVFPRATNYFTGEQIPEHSFGFDATFGFLLYSEYLYLGASSKHLLTSNFDMDPTTTIHAGYYFAIHGRSQYRWQKKFTSGFIYSNQGNVNIVEINTAFRVGPFIAGLSYGSHNKLGIQLGAQGGILKFAYYFNTEINPITNVSGNSHEVLLAIRFNVRCCKCIRRTFYHSLF